MFSDFYFLLLFIALMLGGIAVLIALVVMELRQMQCTLCDIHSTLKRKDDLFSGDDLIGDADWDKAELEVDKVHQPGLKPIHLGQRWKG